MPNLLYRYKCRHDRKLQTRMSDVFFFYHIDNILWYFLRMRFKATIVIKVLLLVTGILRLTETKFG